jgi:inorganic triphosphatase YgiF
MTTDTPALPPQEIELKLRLVGMSPQQALQRMARLPSLARRPRHSQWLLNRYFDTPDLALHAQRCALRLRQVSEHPPGAGIAQPGTTPWIQTLKTAGTSAGGLSQRGEWESAVPSGQLSLEALEHTAWPQLDPDGQRFPTLQPCFETECQRTTWRVRKRDGSLIEVALDIGSVNAGGRSEVLMELELELLKGSPATLFALAAECATHLPLLPSDTSKAERGYRLARGTPPEPVKARATDLARHALPWQVAPPVFTEVLSHFTRNLEGLLQFDAPEWVHQTRVAWRRWRSLNRLLAPWLPDAPDRTPLHPLLEALGRQRDLDVVLHDTLPAWAHTYTHSGSATPDAQRLAEWNTALDRLSAGAQAQRTALRQALADPAVGLCLLALTQWTHHLTYIDRWPCAMPKAAATERGWAAHRMKRWHSKTQALLHAAQGAQGSDPLLHDARLWAKRTRYVSEALAHTLPPKAQKQARRWSRQASEWQTRIGLERDLFNAVHCLEGVGAEPRLVGFVQGLAAALTQPTPP